MSVTLRPVRPDDLSAVLELNQANLPALGSLDLPALEHLVGQSIHTVVGDDDGEIVAALIGLDGPGRDYASLNYAWFSKRFERFLYVDRVVVASTHHGLGLGRRLYEGFIAEAGGGHDVLVAEVNVRPRNDGSLAFHDRMGFEAVGEQDTEGGAKRVRMLAKPLGGRPLQMVSDPEPEAEPAEAAAPEPDAAAVEAEAEAEAQATEPDTAEPAPLVEEPTDAGSNELAALEGDVATVERLLDRFDEIPPAERSTMLDALDGGAPDEGESTQA
ncbi:MAG: GNAT family N-acetyltransferase [Actinomycetota bacterium]